MNKITIAVSSAAVLLLGIAIGGIVYAQVLTLTREGSAIVGRMDYIEISEGDIGLPVCTTSGSGVFEDMPGMMKTFTQGGLTANETMVSFSGNFTQTAPPMSLRLLIDGVEQPSVGGRGFLYVTPADPGLAAWNFVSAPIAPGTHTAKLQWRKDTEDAPCLLDRTMIINHR